MPKLLTLMLTLALSLTLVACGGEEKKDGKDGDKAGEKDGAKDGGKKGQSGTTGSAADVIEKLSAVPDILGEVKDKESAKGAAEKLTALAGELKPLVEKVDTDKALPDDLMQKLTDIKTKAKDALLKAIAADPTNLAGNNELSDAMGKIGEVLKGFGDKDK